MGLALCPTNEQAQNFQELITQAYDMKVMIVSYHDNSLGIVERKKDQAEFKRNVNFPQNSIEEAMSIHKAKVVRIMESLNGR